MNSPVEPGHSNSSTSADKIDRTQTERNQPDWNMSGLPWPANVASNHASSDFRASRGGNPNSTSRYDSYEYAGSHTNRDGSYAKILNGDGSYAKILNRDGSYGAVASGMNHDGSYQYAIRQTSQIKRDNNSHAYTANQLDRAVGSAGIGFASMNAANDIMATGFPRLESAKPLYRNARSVTVLCPYCGNEHQHKIKHISRAGADVLYRTPCQPGFRYKLELTLYGSEIDKERGLFVDAAWQLKCLCKEGDHTGHEGVWFAARSKKNASATIDASHTAGQGPKPPQVLLPRLNEPKTECEPALERAVSLVIENCICDEVAAVKHFLDKSAPALAQSFLHRDHSGEIALLVAAIQISREMVELLLERGADVNAVNKKGETALMNAVSSSAIDNVHALLLAGADVRLGALYLANLHIVNHQDELESALNQFTFPEDLFNYRDCCTIEAMIAMHLEDDRKPIALLCRGSPFPYIMATDVELFWKSSILRPSWDELVQQVALDIGLPKPPPYLRMTPADSTYHAEKKLIAFFLHRHVFLPSDKVPNLELVHEIQRLESMPATQLSVEEKEQLHRLQERQKRHEAVVDLSQYEPTKTLEQAVIRSGRTICQDCEDFKNAVNEFFSLNIEIHWLRYSLRRTRQQNETSLLD